MARTQSKTTLAHASRQTPKPTPKPAATRKPSVSQAIAIPLSIILIVAAILAFAPIPHPPKHVKIPIFGTTRHFKTGEHFLHIRGENTPSWLYLTLHAGPSIAWSVLMPLQHVAWIRRNVPAFHRTSGYIIMATSLLLAVTGLGLLSDYKDSPHPPFFSLHTLNGNSPIPWPTFRLTTALLAAPFLYSLYRAAMAGSSKQYELHRHWATIHTIFGYAIGLERLLLVGSYPLGWVVALYAKIDLREILGYEDTTASLAEAEHDVFALVNIGVLALVMLWLRYEFGGKGSPLARVKKD